MREGKLRVFSPALLWSRERIDTVFTALFQNYRGGRRPNGTMATVDDSNLFCAGMLCTPTIFEPTQFCLYPGMGEDRDRFVEMIQNFRLVEHLSIGSSHVHSEISWKLEEVETRPKVSGNHVSLPIPENERNREEAQSLLDFVNGEKLPCFNIVPKRKKINSTEAVGWSVEARGDRFADLHVIGVMVGQIHIPDNTKWWI